MAKATLEQLKAMAYDLAVNITQNQAKLRQVEETIINYKPDEEPKEEVKEEKK